MSRWWRMSWPVCRMQICMPQQDAIERCSRSLHALIWIYDSSALHMHIRILWLLHFFVCHRMCRGIHIWNDLRWRFTIEDTLYDYDWVWGFTIQIDDIWRSRDLLFTMHIDDLRLWLVECNRTGHRRLPCRWQPCQNICCSSVRKEFK